MKYFAGLSLSLLLSCGPKAPVTTAAAAEAAGAAAVAEVAAAEAASAAAVEKVSVDGITFLTEQYPPFNYEVDGKVQGLAVDLLEAMLQEMGAGTTRADFAVLPWSEGYSRVQSEPGTCLFSMTFTEEREPLFRWVGPIADTRIVVLAKKDAGITVSSPADLAKLTHGVIADDAGHQLLQATGVPDAQMTVAADAATIITALGDGAIQAWAYEEASARYQLAEAGHDAAAFETIHVLKESTTRYACHKDTPDELITGFSAALSSLEASGKQKEIQERYLK